MKVPPHLPHEHVAGGEVPVYEPAVVQQREQAAHVRHHTRDA